MIAKHFFKIAIYFLFFSYVYMGLQAQVTKDLPNYFPVSPNAASFAKQGLFPVDYSTGKINISIPLYTIKTKELSVPICINYNSSGIQLDELASWIGLGWNLNAGGAVIRNVKGVPDSGTPVPYFQNLEFTAENYRILYDQFKAQKNTPGMSDSAYDEFIVSAPGLSGTFYFVNNKAFFKDLQNTVVKTSEINNCLYALTHTLEITKDDGTIYRFGKSLNGYNAFEIFYGETFSYIPDYINAWYLTEIIPANNKNLNDIVSFDYKKLFQSQNYSVVTGETLIDSNITSNVTPTLKSIFPEFSTSEKQFLTTIRFNTGVIDFISTLNREDIENDYKLDKISVYSLKGVVKTLIQEYGFVYDYYIRNGGTISSQYPPNEYNSTLNINSRKKSLKLNQITNNLLNTKHTFEYEGTPLPLRGTTKKDYWGYINTNTGNLTPPTLIKRSSTSAIQDFSYTIGNGDRTANENYMKSGILQKIIYPEGGYSFFEYETNKYFENVSSQTIVSKNASMRVFGSGCTTYGGPSSNSISFTPVNYLYGSGKLNVFFMPASQESGGNTNAKFDSDTFFRPLPFTMGGTYDYSREFGNSQHILSASEFRSGNIGAYGCPFTTITASWQEVTGYTTTLTTKLVGGLRIKSVKNYDGKNINPITIKQFYYENENPLIKERNGCYVRGVFAEDRKSDVLPILSTSSIFDNNLGIFPSISYGKVIEIDSNSDNTLQNGKTEYYYENVPLTRLFELDGVIRFNVFKSPFYSAIYGIGGVNLDLPLNFLTDFNFYKNDLWNHGSLLKTNTYMTGNTINTFKIVKSIVNQYKILKQETLPYNIVFNNFPSQVNPGDYPSSFNLPYNQASDFYSGQFYYAVGETSLGKKVLNSTMETDYDINENPTTVKTTNYFFDNPIHNQVTRIETINSKNDFLKTQLSYPQDLLVTGQSAEMQKLTTQNRIDKPIKTETFVNDVQTSENITKFEESASTGNLLLPKEIHSSKGTVETFPFSNSNRKINFTLYDSDLVNGVTVGNGNVLEYSLENGTPVSIIWGYNKTQPIAKIENAIYSQVASYVSNIQSLSNTGTEDNLISALNALRTSLPGAMITTYTYIPLIGVSTITDPKGYKTTYIYDSFGRLDYVKDADGNVLSKNDYHYKN